MDPTAWLQAFSASFSLASNPIATACSNPAKAREAQVCGALEAQLWATLPSFCSWAVDTPIAFK
jgi:hypothetical protein